MAPRREGGRRKRRAKLINVINANIKWDEQKQRASAEPARGMYMDEKKFFFQNGAIAAMMSKFKQTIGLGVFVRN